MFMLLGLRRQIMILNILQCESSLNSWRSKIGKAGYHAVVDLWESDPEKFGTTESHKEYIADALDGVCFMYKYPDEMVSGLVIKGNQNQRHLSCH
jgi:hypothetical protein